MRLIPLLKMSNSENLHKISGIYIHIPYCLQRCHYCDFATYKFDEIPPPQNYFEMLHRELTYHERFFSKGPLKSVYFGGGTPSLAAPQDISSLLSAIHKLGFQINKETEVTIEINPATITHEKMHLYLSAGINRFSVGAQTFNDKALKHLGREHDAAATIKTLDLLKSYNVNFSFDLLYALPNQTHQQLLVDLEEVTKWSPPHISPYCLTLPDKHSLQKNRPGEEVQIKMFETLNAFLVQSGYERYEISNFSKPGFASKHNQLYWNQKGFWGLGLSAFSFVPKSFKHPFGFRFWNPKTYEGYAKKVASLQDQPIEEAYSASSESLKLHEALTEYCYTSLRQNTGLCLNSFCEFFDKSCWTLVNRSLLRHIESGLVENRNSEHYYLTERGVMVSNMIFSDLTFLKEDLVEVSLL